MPNHETYGLDVFQVKFSELTMDMFRMLQTLEREPQEDFNHIYDASPAPGRIAFVSISAATDFLLAVLAV